MSDTQTTPLTEQDINSINQRIAKRFVDQEVYLCLTSMVNYILREGFKGRDNPPLDWDSVENRTRKVITPDQVRFIVDHTFSNKNEVESYEGKFYRINEDGNDEASPFLIITESDALMARNQEAVEYDELTDGYSMYDFMTDGYLADTNHLPNIRNLTFLAEGDEVEYEEEDNEALEWHAVSSWLYNQLKEQDEMVIDAPDCYLWGRGTSGQAIAMDGVITRILRGMECLYGQSNSDRYQDEP